MPNPTIKDIEGYASFLEDFYNTQIDKHEKRILVSLERLERRIIALTKELKTIKVLDVERLEQTKENFSIAHRIAVQLTQAFNKEYGTEIVSMATDFDKAVEASRDYFKNIDADFQFTQLDKDVTEVLKKEAIATQANIATRYKSSIIQSFYDSVYTGAPYEDLIAEIKNAVTGLTDARGVPLASHAKRIAQDTFMNFFSTVHKKKADDAGFDHFIYYGDVVRDSRPFCSHRAGKLYSAKEIESWQDDDWQGKAPGDIWIVKKEIEVQKFEEEE